MEAPEEEMDDVLPGKKRTVRYKIVGTVDIDDTMTVTQAMSHIAKVVATAKTVGTADAKLSIPRLTDVQL